MRTGETETAQQPRPSTGLPQHAALGGGRRGDWPCLAVRLSRRPAARRRRQRAARGPAAALPQKRENLRLREVTGPVCVVCGPTTVWSLLYGPSSVVRYRIYRVCSSFQRGQLYHHRVYFWLSLRCLRVLSLPGPSKIDTEKRRLGDIRALSWRSRTGRHRPILIRNEGSGNQRAELAWFRSCAAPCR